MCFVCNTHTYVTCTNSLALYWVASIGSMVLFSSVRLPVCECCESVLFAEAVAMLILRSFAFIAVDLLTSGKHNIHIRGRTVKVIFFPLCSLCVFQTAISIFVMSFCLLSENHFSPSFIFFSRHIRCHRQKTVLISHFLKWCVVLTQCHSYCGFIFNKISFCTVICVIGAN